MYIHREIHLPDGRRLIRHDRYDAIQNENSYTNDQMLSANLLRIHPSFRIIALGTPPEKDNPWLTAEVLGIFSHVDTLSVTSLDDKLDIIFHICPPSNDLERDLFSLLRICSSRLQDVASNGESSSISNLSLSCRQLLRLWTLSKSDMNKSLESDCAMDAVGWKQEVVSDVNNKLLRMFMLPFMPTSLRDAFQSKLSEHLDATVMKDVNIFPPSLIEKERSSAREGKTVANHENIETVRIGKNVLQSHAPKHPELVPDTRFYSISRHLSYLEDIGNDVLANERHILLIGNQGRS